MTDYKGCTIKNIRKFPGKGGIVYACLYSAEGDLLISATLEYIMQALEERMEN